MGLFSRRSRVKAVQVIFRDLTVSDSTSLNANSAYTYAWRFKEDPHVGQWVRVQGSDRIATAFISALGKGGIDHALALSPVVSVLTEAELQHFARVRAAHAKREQQSLETWLDMARKKAKLPVDRELPSKAPGDLPAVPPASGSSTGQRARNYATVWWRIYNRASETGRPSDEVAAFKLIAHKWYAKARKSA